MSLGTAFSPLVSTDLKRVSNQAFGRVNFNLFFDRVEITSRLEQKELRVLGGTGAYGRGAMRRGIRKAGKRYKASEHTGPPRYHTRGFASLKDGIFFTANLNQGAVAIGPNKLRTRVRPHGLASGAQLLNEGGSAEMLVFRYNKPYRNGRPRAGRWQKVKARWKRRNFTEPAFEPTQKKMRELMEKYEL